jgi:dTDP-4-dehydrorhamnose reductase
MLGRAVMTACQGHGHEVAGYDLPEIDITKMDGREIEECDWIVNCAAYTQVDNAEDEPTKAFEVNACGAGRLARMCNANKWRMLQVSTDYVFDGTMMIPYKEEDQTNPLNNYGMSKFIGETLVWRECPDVLIVRTQSLFGNYGANFVRAILKQVEAGKELNVVDDQISCPTYVGHLAEAMVSLIEKDIKGETVHVSSDGFCSWLQFARAILEAKGIKDVLVNPIFTENLKSKALRPKWSVLNKDLYMSLTGKDMPTWQEGLKEYLANMIYP